MFPQNPRCRKTGSWGRYGPTRSEASRILESLKAIDKNNSNFTLMDENKNGNYDYSDKMALNTVHLSSLGAQEITERLDSIIKG